MAYYSPRPDGLVNVALDDGRLLPMQEQHAQAAGILPMPDASAAIGGPNPYGGLPPDAVAGPGGGANPDMAAISGALAQQSAAPPPPPGISAPSSGLNLPPNTSFIVPPGANGKPLPDFQAGIQRLKDEGPKTDPDAAGAAAAPGGLRRIMPTARGEAAAGSQDQAARTVKISPDRDVRASFVVKPGVEADPDFQQTANELSPAGEYEQHMFGANHAYMARQEAITAQTQANNAVLAQQEQLRTQIASNRAALQQKLDTLDQRQSEAEQATPQTRGEIIQSRGSLAGVLSGISIALGGYVQGLKGGANPGLEIVNQSIQDEIASQRAKWEATKDKQAAANTAYGRALQLYGDPNAAEADMYTRGLTLAANIANNHWKQADNEDEMVKQRQIAQQLMEQAAEKKQAAYTLIHGQIAQENFVHQNAQYATIGGAPHEPPANVDKMVTLPNGTRAWATRADGAKAAQETVSEAALLDSQLAQLKKLTASAGARTWTADEHARAETLKNEMFNTYRKVHGYSRFSEAEKTNFDKGLGNQEDFFHNPNVSGHLEELRRQGANKVNATLGELYTDPTYERALLEPDAGSFTSGGPSPLSFPEQGRINMPPPKKSGKGGKSRSSGGSVAVESSEGDDAEAPD